MVALLLGAAPIYCRGLFEARLALQEARASPDFSTRVEHYRTALSWYLPGNWYSSEAAVRLGQELEDPLLSPDQHFLGLVALRSGLFMTRSIFPSSFDQQRLEVESQLKEFLPKTHIQETPTPQINQGYALLSQLGFWGWVCSVIGTIMSAMNKRGDWSRVRLARGALLSTVFFILWLVALRLA